MASPSKMYDPLTVCSFHPEAALIQGYTAGDKVCPECGLVVERSTLSDESLAALDYKPHRMRTTAEPVACPDHPRAFLIEDYRTGDLICESCGLVVIDRIIGACNQSNRSSANSSASESDPEAGEDDLMTVDRSLGTKIARREVCSVKTSVKSTTAKRCRNKMMITASEQSEAISRSLSKISKLADQLNLSSSTANISIALYRRITQAEGLKGTIDAAVIASCIYMACREQGDPRSFQEIGEISTASAKEIGRCFVQMTEALQDSVSTDNFVSAYCGNLKLSHESEMSATRIARRVEELELASGICPAEVTAAAIYIATQASAAPKTQKQVSEACAISVAKIRQCCKLINPHANKLFKE